MPSKDGLNFFSKEIKAIQKEAKELEKNLSQSISRAEGFLLSMDKLENQIVGLQSRLAREEDELGLNELLVISDKIVSELNTLDESAASANAFSCSPYIKKELKQIQNLLSKTKADYDLLKKRFEGKRSPPTKIALLSLANQILLCRRKLSRLKPMLLSKSGSAQKRLACAKQEAQRLRKSISDTIALKARLRLKDKISASKSKIVSFMKSQRAGRIFLDQKNLLVKADGKSLVLPFNQQVKFCLEDLFPISHSFEHIGKSSVVVGKFSCQNGLIKISIGERALAGDMFIYKEKEFTI